MCYSCNMAFLRRTKNRPKTYWLGQRVQELPDFIPASVRGASLRITEIGEPVLHNKAKPVTVFGTPDLEELIDDMFSTMDIAEGVGLAAPQIGVDKQVFVYDVPDDNGDRHVGYIINPELTVLDETPLNREEGCLSVPGASAELERASKVEVKGYDFKGQPLHLTANGYLARAFLHEYQHLQGTLYWDHLLPEEQKRALAERDSRRSEVLNRRAEMAEIFQKPHPPYPTQPAGGR